jgi:hypothetical protein
MKFALREYKQEGLDKKEEKDLRDIIYSKLSLVDGKVRPGKSGDRIVFIDVPVGNSLPERLAKATEFLSVLDDELDLQELGISVLPSKKKVSQLDFFYKANNNAFMILDFKSAKMPASTKTKVYEFIPILVGCGYLLYNEKIDRLTKTRMLTKAALNDMDMSEKDINDLLSQFNSASIPEAQKKSALLQAETIRTKLVEKLGTVSYSIVSDKSSVGKEIKSVGQSLVSASTGGKVNLPADKFANYDMVFVRDKSFHTNFNLDSSEKSFVEQERARRKLIGYVNSFASTLNAFKTGKIGTGTNRDIVNYLGLSMKITEHSQAGKGSTYFNEIINVGESIKKESEEFTTTLEKSTTKAKGMFDSLQATILLDIKRLNRQIPTKLINPENFETFWLSRDTVNALIVQKKKQIAAEKNEKKIKGIKEKLLELENIYKNKNFMDKILLKKYKSMTFVHKLLEGKSEHLLGLLHSALTLSEGYNPSYFKVEGTSIVAYDVEKMDMTINATPPTKSGGNPVTINFAASELSGAIYVTVPVKLHIIDMSGALQSRVSNAMIQFKCDGDRVVPELQSFHLSEQGKKQVEKLINEQIDRILNIINIQ